MKNFFKENRKKIFAEMENNSCLLLSSGIIYPKSNDQEYYFEVNKNFYYLTGINQSDVFLLMIKENEVDKEFLFIQENDPVFIKWNGEKISKKEAEELSGIEKIEYQQNFDKAIFNLFNLSRRNQTLLKNIYLDLERIRNNNVEYFGIKFSKNFSEKYPEINIYNCYPMIVKYRTKKENVEILKIKESIETTKQALEKIMEQLKPGLLEYQIETVFDSHIKENGQRDHAFQTICATGKNATILHYTKNNAILKENDLILFDLGCRTDFYVSDISRTYPVNGKFTERQRKIYEIVLNCNKECIAFVKPGITWEELNKYANSLLIDGLKNLNIINNESQLVNYYWHSIGHSIGLDTHDPEMFALETHGEFIPGMVITIEPGLYFEDEGIGIRIEDNILITEDGAINLSIDIIKEIADIEKFMKKKDNK